MPDKHGGPGGQGPSDEVYENEARQLPILLHQLCQTIQEPEPPNRHRRMSMRGMLFCLVWKSYHLRMSARRVRPLFLDALAKGFITAVPDANTILDYQRKFEVSPYLEEMIGRSGLAFRPFEQAFAIDSTRLLAWGYHLRKDKRTKGLVEKPKKIRLHVICGTQTGIVTAARATSVGDAEQYYFDPLLRETIKLGFNVRVVIGDSNYLSHRNFAIADDLNVKLILTPKSNSVMSKDGSDPLWDKNLELFRTDDAEALDAMYARKMVETAFSAVKRRFGRSVAGRVDISQYNEALCKVVCYNLSVLHRYMHDHGLTPEFNL